MSQTDVIRAFLDGGQLHEADLRTDGQKLYSSGMLIAEKREGKLQVAEEGAGAMEAGHRQLLLDFIGWHEQRRKVLRRLVDGRHDLSWPRA